MIDAYASERHLLDHIAPVWLALPTKLRGQLLVDPAIAQHAPQLQLVTVERKQLLIGTGPILVASIRDLRRTGRRPAVFLEHGSGQHYSNGHASYAGGRDRGAVVLFLAPSERVSARNLESYPSARSIAVGCPKLDEAHRHPAHGSAVAISFHWDCPISPEARSAWRHYRRVLADLPVAFGTVLGHAHPRLFDTIAPVYERAGITPVRDFDEVLKRAAVYAVDNSSTLYEFASTGRPVVVMNAPWYRRRVEHGLRFWEFADVGVQVNKPEELVEAISRALADPPAVRARREGIVRQVYAYTDGHAAERAATAIEELLEGGVGGGSVPEAGRHGAGAHGAADR